MSSRIPHAILFFIIFLNLSYSQSIIVTTDVSSGWAITKTAQIFNPNTLSPTVDWLVNTNNGLLNSTWTFDVALANLAGTQINVNNNVGNSSKPIWIVSNTCLGVDDATETVQYNFRKVFNLEEGCIDISKATFRYACDNLSRIYINGIQIKSANGFYQYPGTDLICSNVCGTASNASVSVPAGSDFNSRPFDVVEIADIKSLLLPGDNVIAMEIINTGGCGVNFAWINANLQIDFKASVLQVQIKDIIQKNCNSFGSFKVEPISGKAPFTYKVQGQMNQTGIFENLNSGIYTVEITDANNCKTFIEVEIKDEGIIPKLEILVLDSLIDCADDKAFINVSATGGNIIKYSFDNGPYSVQNNFSNLSPGMHSISAINEFGCVSDSIPFEVFSNLDFILKFYSAELCSVDSITIFVKKYIAYGSYNDTILSPGICDTLYYISLKEKKQPSSSIDIELCYGENITIGNSTYDTQGQFIQIIPLESACDSLLNININIIDEKRSEGDYLICEGDSIRIGSNNYFSEEGNFEQVLTSDSGCDSLILLRISYKDEELCENGVCGKYYIPNVFSPNNDGINDEFEVVVKNVTINYMAIFNRWGGVVFSSNDINPKWNGMFKNLEVNPGVYVYMIRGFCNNNKPIFEYGDITVFR